MTQQEWLAGYLGPGLLLLGIPMLVAASVNAWIAIRLVLRGIEAQGTIVATTRSRLSASDAHHGIAQYRYAQRPVVEFAIAAGERVRITSNVGSARYKGHQEAGGPLVGAGVTVLYHPERPHQGRIRSFETLWLLPLVLAGWGSINVVAGAYLVGWLT